ncbi:glycosyltransferase [Thiohalocapsa marina]|uniref:Glycosyltransferase n=1 Tax=Thiohalocapsa marina TaxID=424902 RepID=A0A5M8FUJ6_9GAMM|nr:glycosyltransferase [Thiohalocapsa marina]KAA6187409.1 glycosyltransferase [Thiohalocapsa marina]
MSAPRVSVLTATHNGSEYLDRTIRSVLHQTFEDFEYLIVDDASTDNSLTIIHEHARQDHRIRPIAHPVQAGPPGALNLALSAARGDYIAILDHDDLALPKRLERQLEFMDRHPDHGAVGSAVRQIDGYGNTLRHQTYPLHPAAAHWGLLFGASLLHSASMYRRSLVERLGGYSTNHAYLCDYELLIRIAQQARITNLPDVLACYRRHDDQTSARHSQRQNGQMLLLQYALQAAWLHHRPSLEVFSAMRRWMYGHPPAEPALAAAAVESLRTLFGQYLQGFTPQPSDQEAVALDCARRWAKMAHYSYRLHPQFSRDCWREARRLAPNLKADLAFRRSLRRR